MRRGLIKARRVPVQSAGASPPQQPDDAESLQGVADWLGARRAHSRRSVSNGFRSRSPREVVNAEDVGDVEAVVTDAQPVARGELDNLDGPAARGAVAVTHLAILP